MLINQPNDPELRDPLRKAAIETQQKIVSVNIDMHVAPVPNNTRVKGNEFVAPYANYYACNRGIITAEFGDVETNAIARDALLSHYRGREVVRS